MARPEKPSMFPLRSARKPPVSANDPSRREDWLVALFGLGCMLFSPLILQTFTQASPLVAGVPPFVLYLFGSWLGLIVLVVCVVEIDSPRAASGEGDTGRSAADRRRP